MRLKHVLFSSLFLSAALVACTNEDFSDTTAKADLSRAISLGEGYEISVAKAGEADTKAFYEESGDNLIASWENDDVIGAAFYNMIEDGDFNPSSLLVTGSPVPFNGTLVSNHPFDFKSGNEKSATFESKTNAFAGAYILYYPFKEISAGYKGVPFSVAQVQEFDTQDPLKLISDNMQYYTTAKFIPGGYQTQEFSMQRVPAIFKLLLTPGKVVNNGLYGNVTVKKIVLIAKDAAGNVLATEGAVTTNGVVTKDQYNKNLLAETVDYNGTNEVDHYSVEVENGENSDYQLITEGVATKKPFYFATLPFTRKATTVTVKAVTDAGTFATTYVDGRSAEETAKVKAFNEAVQKNVNPDATNVVYVNVTLATQELDDVIYMEDDFVAKWNELKTTGGEIRVGENLIIDADLEFAAYGKEINVVYVDANSENYTTDHEITINSLKVTNGTVNFSNALKAKNIEVVAGELNAETIEAEEMTVSNLININYTEIGKLTVMGGGTATVTPANASASISEIFVQKTANGTSTLIAGEANGVPVMLNEITNDGKVTLANAQTDSESVFTNNGEIQLTGDFTNKGQFILDGTLVVPVAATFTNAAGATLEIVAGDIDTTAKKSLTIKNEDEDEDKGLAAGEITIDKDVTVTLNTYISLENAGKLSIDGTLAATAKDKLASTGVIYVNDGATLQKYMNKNVYDTNATAGYIVLANNSTFKNQMNGDWAVCEVASTEDLNNLDATSITITGQKKNLSAIMVSGDATVSTSENVAKFASCWLILNGDVTLTLGQNLNIYAVKEVIGDAVITATSNVTLSTSSKSSVAAPNSLTFTGKVNYTADQFEGNVVNKTTL